MKKLRSRHGMTLAETLCTVLVVLIISGMLMVGVGFGVKTYRESMAASQAQVLCSTLTAAISDKLRYSGEMGEDGSMFVPGIGTAGQEDRGTFALNADGEVVVALSGGDAFKLLGSASYPQGLRVAVPGETDRLVSYNAARGIFTVAFAVVDEAGDTLKETNFDVKRINFYTT